MARETPYKGILIDPNEFNMGKPRYPGIEYAHLKHQFYKNTVADLAIIASYSLGRELLDLIAKRHDGIGTSGRGADRTVTILFRPPDKGPGAGTGAMKEEEKFSVSKSFGGRQFTFAGRGSKTQIRMHNGPGSSKIYAKLVGVNTPVWIVLAHELIHAYHHLSGTTYRDEVINKDGKSVRREEMATTGLGVYASTRLSENALRNAAGLPLRTYYTFPNDHSYIPSLVESGPIVRRGSWYCACMQREFGDI